MSEVIVPLDSHQKIDWIIGHNQIFNQYSDFAFHLGVTRYDFSWKQIE